MRKVTKEIVNAFLNCQKKTIGNTMTDGVSIYLHGNRIAWRDESDSYHISMCGWGTPTTRERLNGLLQEVAPHLFVSQKKGQNLLFNRNTNVAIPLIQQHADVEVNVGFGV